MKSFYLIRAIVFLSVVSCGFDSSINQKSSSSVGSNSSASQGENDQTPVACTMIYAPVCGQPPMPVCPDGMMCAQVMPNPKTYGNRCQAESSGATVISEGECANLN